MSAGQGSCPLPWHRASFFADLFPQSQPHRAALEVRQKTVPLFDLLQRLRRLQTGHLRLPCSNQHRPQGHSRFPPHPPFPDILKITDREEVKYISEFWSPKCGSRASTTAGFYGDAFVVSNGSGERAVGAVAAISTRQERVRDRAAVPTPDTRAGGAARARWAAAGPAAEQNRSRFPILIFSPPAALRRAAR